MPKLSLAGFKDPARRPALYPVDAVCRAWPRRGHDRRPGRHVDLLVLRRTAATRSRTTRSSPIDSRSHAKSPAWRATCRSTPSPSRSCCTRSRRSARLYLTITNTYELPLERWLASRAGRRAHGLRAVHQCHSENREITPAKGIIIDHAIHEENDVHCTVCHNRTAHPEDFELTLAGNEKHDDFMEMTACFRCHGHDAEAEAPGDCEPCHPADFELKPANHFEAGFYEEFGDSAGHAELAARRPRERRRSDTRGGRGRARGEGEHVLPTVESINYCSTCHFPRLLHGLPWRRDAASGGFEEGHGDSEATPEVCANCHGPQARRRYGVLQRVPSRRGRSGAAVDPAALRGRADAGAEACFECHNPTYCAECHVRGLGG